MTRKNLRKKVMTQINNNRTTMKLKEFKVVILLINKIIDKAMRQKMKMTKKKSILT